MKRLISLLLCAWLLAGLAVPAAASETTADNRLTQITQAVKKTLSLDTSMYEDFHGDCYQQDLADVWTLQWSGSSGSLTVEALNDGTVVGMRLNDLDTSSGIDGSFPTFPAGDPEQARKAAQTFLGRVLDGPTESVVLDEPSGLDRLNSTSYTFSGSLLLNSLPSPLTYSVTVRASDNQVTRFRRDIPDSSFLGEIPSASPRISRSQAAASLKETLSLRLEYVLPDVDSTTAVLRYLPDSVHTYYVDANTGSLLDLTEWGAKAYPATGDASSAESAADAGANGGALSQAEQEGIAKLEGVLPSSQLDRQLRAVSAYGLTGYTLISSAYTLQKADPDRADSEELVLCTLRYSRTEGENVLSRTFQVDARTGVVQSVSSWAPWEDAHTAAVRPSQAQANAETFLKSFAPSRFQDLALYETDDRTADGAPYYTFTFARKVNGYFFPENSYTVAIDAADGSVFRLDYTWQDALTFDAPSGLLSAQEALNAWMGTYEVTLAYRLFPVELNAADPIHKRLLEQGYSYFYELLLTYGLEREDLYAGIDAKSGQAVRQETGENLPAYQDLAGCWAKTEIETLAKYGVGYDADTFQPGKALTQWDLVCLLASLQGLRLDPAAADEQSHNSAYAVAYEMGALSRAQRDDNGLLTRGDVVKYLLNGAGYGSVARLQGIFTCSYADRASIPKADLGYAALAQGLGLVQGNYAGSRTASRGEAAVMLYRLLGRN